jgi:hypothetical protein
MMSLLYPQEVVIMAYELFKIKSTRIGSPALTITADGRIALNADSGDILRRAGANYVQILWDAKTFKMALRPLTKPTESAYKLSAKSGKRGMAFSGFTFLRHLGWSFGESSTIPVEWNEKEKLLEAQLPQEKINEGW